MKPTYEQLEQKVQKLEKALYELEWSAERSKEDALQYRNIFNNAQIGIYRSRLSDGKILECNDRFARIVGYPNREACIGDFVASEHYVDPGTREKMVAVIKEEGKVQNFEARATRCDGSMIWVRYSGTLNPEQDYIEGVLADITDYKQTEEALQKSSDQYRSLVENAGEAIFIVQDGGLEFANKKAVEMSGYTQDEMLSVPFETFIHPEDRALVADFHIKRLQGIKVPNDYNFRVINKSGDTIWVEVNAIVVDWEEKPAVLIFLRNVTERKAAEDALRESEERYRSLVENTLEGYFVSEIPSGRFVYLNQAICSLFGYTMEEGLSLHVWDVIDPQEHSRVQMRIQERMDGTASIHGSDIYTAIRKDGSQFRAEVSNSLVTYHGKLVIQGILRDVTEKEKLQLQLLQSRKMESVGRLAGGVAHDFNNMLGVILGHAELAMLQGDPDSPVQADLEEIQKAAQRSADLTRQLLAFARKQMVAPKVVDLNEAVAGMLKMLRRLIGEDIDLVWKPGGDPWPVKIDPAQVDQILANLCVNARDAISGVGKVSIQTKNVVLDDAYCKIHEGATPGEYVMLAITDDGRGMDKETLEKIFEPFFTTKEIGEGTGLGLSTVYGIVKQNNGYINAYSEPEKGSTFKIYLPKSEQPIQIDRESDAGSVSKGTETVLLVEDEPSILSMGKTVLERFGYTVLAGQTPSEALALAEQHDGPIHLLVTDVVMPEMNGRELKERIEAHKSNFKVLYMSGYTENAIVHRGILEEGVNFLEKPFSVNSLAGKVRKVLDTK